MNKSVIYKLCFLMLHSFAFGLEPVKAYSIVDGNNIKITFHNNTEDFFFLSDPNYFGLTVLTKNGGRVLGNQSFDKKNTKLIFLYPKNKEFPNKEAQHSVTFEVANFKDILSGGKKVVVWGCKLSGVIDYKNLYMERLEIELIDSK